MKLLNKTSIYYLLFALPVFAICSASLYYFISSKVIQKLDQSLKKEKMEIQEKLESGVEINSLKDDEVCFKVITAKDTTNTVKAKSPDTKVEGNNSDDDTDENGVEDKVSENSADDDDDENEGDSIKIKSAEVLMQEKCIADTKYHYSDSLLYDSAKVEMAPYRALKATVCDSKNNYEITLLESYAESDNLTAGILLPVLVLFIVLLIGFFLINVWISKRLWKPFYKTLQRLEHYKIEETSIKFDSTTIKEFSELNAVLAEMAKKIYSDYSSQKQFIENASHEIQTPLAIINSKIELLIQSKTISETDVQIIQSVYKASNKISSLNKALLLLSKIENHQFKDVEEIQFETLIEKILDHFAEMISLKNINIEKKYYTEVKHNMNAALADILFTNLFQNAIRHNVKDGTISVQLLRNSIMISNTGNISIANTNELFQRFKKNEGSAESIGLGLAIVKEICDNYNIGITYTCSNTIHTIQLNF